MEKSSVEIEKDGHLVRGFHTPDCPWLWFRDNIHMMNTSAYLEEDIRSAIDFMLSTQQPDGSFLDYLAQDSSMQRIPTEADLEYLAVLGVYRAWLATGDDEWMESCLPSLKRGLNYMTSHPWRWDPEHQMPKRAYTIDTWDFDYRDDLEGLHWPGKIDDKTHFGIMHGDVSGLLAAWRRMSSMHAALGRMEEGTGYMGKSGDLQKAANRLLWNGRFYRHRLPLDGLKLEGVDEDEQLSLSNTYDMNRGMPTPEMAQSIIREYMKRRAETDAFAEWFSIDPPFPEGVFGDERLKPGVYVNGGIMPLVGGELAHAAFYYGFPEYGVDILQRYFQMIDSTGESYLWYFPDGKPATREAGTSPEAYPYDAWGGAAMANALIGGLAGVRPRIPGFKAIQFEPQWKEAGVYRADVTLEYPASGSRFHYIYEYDPESKTTDIVIDSRLTKAMHILLPGSVEKVNATDGGTRLDVRLGEWHLGKQSGLLSDLVHEELRITYREK